MTRIRHLNCGTIVAPSYPTVVCHCLLLEDAGRLALVDSGIGLLDVQLQEQRLGQGLIDAVGFQFNEPDTAVRRIERLGFDAAQVQHIVLTHCDPDHAGGLADFPNAVVHVAEEELAALNSGNPRYVLPQFAHCPRWETHGRSARRWFELEARPVDLGFTSEVLLVPLPGHTAGHCGVAVRDQDGWLLHAGDAYYLRVELSTDDHPVSLLAAQRADDDDARRQSLSQLRRLLRDQGDTVAVVGYHDLDELPPECLPW